MSIKLDPRWQEEAYKQISDDFLEKNRSCIVAPTGCGKTALGLKLMEENPNKNYIWVTSSAVAIHQIKRLISETYENEKPFPNLRFMTYNALSRMEKGHFEKLKTNTMIFDELHRAGAPIWNLRVKELIKNNENANILGLTATPIRTDGRNMADEICGKVSYKLDLTEAMARGILPIPIYIIARYMFEEDIQEMLDTAELIENEEKKKEIKDLIKQASMKLEKASGLQDIFSKYMSSTGKYIIFCRSVKHMHELEELLKGENGWFNKVNPNLKIVKIFSENEKEENEKTMEFLRAKAGDNLIVALSRDMLNESFHDREMSGVIMARPTKSERLFRQQLGRALMRYTDQIPIIFDLVDNIMSFELLRIEIKQIIEREIARGNTKLYDKKILDGFQIFAEQLEVMEEFNKIENLLNEYLKGETDVQKIYKICKDLHEAGYDFTNFKLHTKNRFTNIYELQLPSEVIDEIIKQHQIPKDFEIGKYIEKIRSMYRGARNYRAMNEQDRKDIESISRTYW